jgi:hypothetical protein
LTTVVSACASGRTTLEGPAAPAEAGRHNAALAYVIVENATAEELAVVFRTTASPGRETIIGRVGPGDRNRLAPVPATEPILLAVRRADGAELRLDAKTLAIDAEWIWRIPRDAVFQQPAK